MPRFFLTIISAAFFCTSSLGTAADTTPESSTGRPYRLVTPPSPTRTGAEALLETVRSEIPKAEVTKRTEKKLFHRIVAGRFSDITTAGQLRAELAKKNVASLVMQSKDKFTVVISSFLSVQLARDEQKRLVEKGIKTDIVKFNQAQSYWQVNSVDGYELRDAVYAASLMTMKDIVTTIE
jgi:cell division protein FtsN